jgi:hypothetical protein
MFDAHGFLRYANGERLMWLPAHLRGNTITVFNDTVAVGGEGGAITFVRCSR